MPPRKLANKTVKVSSKAEKKSTITMTIKKPTERYSKKFIKKCCSTDTPRRLEEYYSVIRAKIPQMYIDILLHLYSTTCNDQLTPAEFNDLLGSEECLFKHTVIKRERSEALDVVKQLLNRDLKWNNKHDILLGNVVFNELIKLIRRSEMCMKYRNRKTLRASDVSFPEDLKGYAALTESNDYEDIESSNEENHDPRIPAAGKI